MKNRNQVMKCNETRHYKMYKAGKRFLYASVSMVTLGSWMFLSQDVHAATQTSTAVAPSTTAISTDSGQVRTHSDAQASSNAQGYQATPAVSNQATTDTSTSSVKTINQLDGQYIDDKGNVSSTKPSVATGANQAAVTNNKIPTSVNDNFVGQGGQNDSSKHVAIDSTGDYGKVYQDADNKQWVKLVDDENAVAASYSFKNQIDTTSRFDVQGEWYMSKDNPGGGLGVILQPVNPQAAGISKTSDASVDIGIQGQPNTTFLGFDGYTSEQPDDHDTKPGTLTIRQTDNHTTSIGTSGGGFNPLTLDDDQSINAQYVQQAGPDDLLGKIAQLLIGTKPDIYQDSPYATIGLPDAPADPNQAGPKLDVLFDIQWLPNSDIADFDNKVSGTLSVAVYDTTDTAMQNPLGKVVTDNTELPSATSIALFGAMGGTGADQVHYRGGATIPGGLIQGRINSYSFEKVPQTVTVNYINNDTGEQISSQKTTTINASVGNTLEVTETTSGKTASYGAPVIPGYTFLGAVGTDVTGHYQKNSMDVVNTQMLTNASKGHYNTINVYYTQRPSVTRTIDAYQVPKTESTPAQDVPQVTQSSVGNIVAVTPEIGVSLPGKTPIKDARNQNIKLSAGLSPISIRPADGYTSGYTIKGKGNWIAATDIPPINGTDGNTYIVQYAANKIKEQFVDQNGTAIIPDGEITGLAKGMIAVTPASIPGYTYDAGYKATTTDNPVRLTVASLNGQSVVTLHYRANDQKINVQFKDQNGKSLDNVELTGVSDGVVNYQPAFQRQQALLSQGYTLNVAKNGLAAAEQNFDRDDHATPNYVVYLNKIENTTALMTLTPVLQNTDGSVTPVPYSAVTKVEQVPGSIITAQTIEGYTPIQSQITIPTPVPTSENFVNGKFIGTNINVVYTPNEGNGMVVITTSQGSKTITGIDGRTGQTVNIPTPSVDGYTPNRATLTGVVNPNGSITVTTPKNPDKTDVTYTGNPTSLTITFVSQEKGEAVIGTQIITGKVGDKVQAQTAVPTNYVLVNENDKTVGQTLTSGDNSLTIKVKHQHSTALPADFNGTTTRTINFTGVNGTNPNPVTQTATWTADTDLVTGVTTYTSKNNYAAVSAPTVAGYAADQDTVPAETNQATTVKPESTAVNVNYTGNQTNLTITFVDQDKSEAVVGTQTITGKVGDKVQEKTTVPAHSVLVNENDKTIDQTLTSGDNSLTIKVKHQHSTTLPADFNGTTTRTINFTGVNGNNPKAVTQTATWTTDTDLATGVTTYTSKDGYAAFDVPAVDGYTADQDTVPAVTNQSTTAKPTNRTVTVTYKGKATSLTVTYADQDDDGAAVGTQVLAGKVGDEVKAQANVPDNYELVSDNDQTIDQTLTADGNALTIKVKHQHSTALPAGFDGTTTRTINFSGVHGTNPKSVIQTVNWTTDTDLVTGVTTYTPKNDYAAVSAPTVAGYTANQDTVPAETNQATTVKPESTAVNVSYTGNQTNLTVTFVDQDKGEAVVGTQVLAGKVGDEVKGQANVPTNYELVSDNDQTIDQTLTADGNALTIKVKHQHSTVLPADFNGTTTRTINFTGVVNGANPKAVTQTANWTTDTDLATGVTTYTPLDGYEAVTVPTVAGYTADQDTVSAYTNQPTTAKPENSVLNVIYTGNQTNLAVTFADQDNGGISVGTQTMTGKVGDEVKGQANVPVNYVLVNDSDQTIDQILTADGNALTIKVKHQHSTVLPAEFNGTTTRTINFTGVNGTNPKAITQTANWVTDTDLATGVTTYTPLDGYEAVIVPTVTGYTADQDTVPAETNQVATEKPADSTVSVVYTGNQTNLAVTYADQDNGGAAVGTQVLAGKVGDEVKAQANVPTNYELVNDSDQTIDQTLAADGNALTIKVKHQHSTVLPADFNGATTRTINFTGVNGTNPKAVTQTANWTTDTDLATGVTTYTPLDGYEAVTVPTVAGYTANQDTVPAETNQAATEKPADSTVSVAYKADSQSIQVRFVDKQTGKELGTTTLSGSSDDNIDYQPAFEAQQNLLNQGYTLNKKNQNGLSSATKTFNVYGKTPTYVVELNRIESVELGKVTTDGVPSANQYTINFTDYDGNVVGKITFVGNAGDNYDLKGNLPKGYVLTPGQTNTVVSVPKGQDPKTPLTVNVTTPAGQDTDGIEVVTKEQVDDDVASANQYTINFTDYNGNVVGTTTVDGNPGDSFNITSQIPKGYVSTPGKDGMVSLSTDGDSSQPISYNVTTPAGQDTEGIEVVTKEQVDDDVASANQYTISFTDYNSNVVGTTSFAGNTGDNYDFQANLPEGYVLTPGQTSTVVSVPKGQDPSKPLTVHVTTPAGQTADGIEVGTKEQVAKDVPSANQYMINFTDYSGKVVGTATVDGNAGDSFNITSQLPKGYVSAPGEDGMVSFPTDENSDQSIGYHVTTPAGQDTDGIQSFFAEKVLSNSQSVTQDDYYDYTQPGQLTDGIQTFFKGQVSDGQSVNGNQYYDYMLAGQLAAGIHSYFKGQVSSDSPSVALDKYYDLTQKNHAAEDDLTSVSESNATAGRGSSKADRLDNHGEISSEVSGQSNGGAVANIGTNSETHSGMSAGAAASTSEARVTLQSQKSASQNRLPQNKAQTTANKMPQTNEQRAEIASLLGSELLLGSIGLHEMKRKKHSH
ncbi:adhesion exoprotein [Secundilactobacillus pentosiphilus]|uniref:Adhesion exoprotein n=1 Tax=Secundilactobacillus pentosiphilus TaxID=1714682 RepID=A0A1Z5IWZ1_9LACO|nr:MucBP domain-containing protein [Secundilactobacillus pentosiphilus]GAX06108.1 adhesion exoprotein [Secundilactobacillus pentosiphilus]